MIFKVAAIYAGLFMKCLLSFRSIYLVVLISLVFFTQHVRAEWFSGAGLSTYYTDDVALFSVTRRLSLEDDPTQPIVDEPGQGSGFVYEPTARLGWSTENTLGKFQVSADAGGYVFQNHSDYSHAFFDFTVAQELTEKTELKLLYAFVPNLYLGEQALGEHHSGVAEEYGERLDSHVWSLHLDHKLTESLTLRGLVRYGVRDYEQPFAYRDTQFYTVGTHLEWEISHDLELLVGYHFEQGLTNDDETAIYQDDIGYFNNYFSAELKAHLLPELTLMLIFDYEHNTFTSDYAEDRHYQGNENIYQGDIELAYALTEQVKLTAGWQIGSRKFNYESDNVLNNNVWLGFEFEI